MPRPLRLWFPGAWYHVTARGNNRDAVFRVEADFRCYLGLLRMAVVQFGCRLHAYALMSNHVHLMLETGDVSISCVMYELHSRYAAYLNRRRRHVGHVFQGRFHTRLVERNTYALELSRYIHLNPVRAHLVDDPAAYPWSSYRAYVQEPDTLVTTEIVLALVGSGRDDPRNVYRTFIANGLTAHLVPEPTRWASLAYIRQVQKEQKGASPLFVK